MANSREAIAGKWLECIMCTYPAESARFIAAEQDRFRNPVGHTFAAATAIIVDELVGDMNVSRVLAALDSMVKIRAVQSFTPGSALAFIFELKKIVRESNAETPFELLCERIDEMALIAFDLYVKCREQHVRDSRERSEAASLDSRARFAGERRRRLG